MAEFLRRPNGTIDLVATWKPIAERDCLPLVKPVNFLRNVERYRQINSRQAASVALAFADYIAEEVRRG